MTNSIPDPSIIGYTVCEFHGTGDRYFGGTADDRPLGTSGSFLTGCYLRDEIAEFATVAEAQAALDAAPNKRTGGNVGIIPVRAFMNNRHRAREKALTLG
jgi:hypothetical protein